MNNSNQNALPILQKSTLPSFNCKYFDNDFQCHLLENKKSKSLADGRRVKKGALLTTVTLRRY